MAKIMTLAVFLLCGVGPASAQSCRDLVSGLPEHREVLFCQGEHLDWAAAVVQHWEQTGVVASDYEECVRPEVSFKTFDVIERSCPQNADLRLMHGCGPNPVQFPYVMAINGQVHMNALHRWYRIQLGRYLYACTGVGVENWPWWLIPIEWA